jgi:hypothetical protein
MGIWFSCMYLVIITFSLLSGTGDWTQKHTFSLLRKIVFCVFTSNWLPSLSWWLFLKSWENRCHQLKITSSFHYQTLSPCSALPQVIVKGMYLLATFPLRLRILGPQASSRATLLQLDPPFSITFSHSSGSFLYCMKSCLTITHL